MNILSGLYHCFHDCYLVRKQERSTENLRREGVWPSMRSEDMETHNARRRIHLRALRHPRVPRNQIYEEYPIEVVLSR